MYLAILGNLYEYYWVDNPCHFGNYLHCFQVISQQIQNIVQKASQDA